MPINALAYICFIEFSYFFLVCTRNLWFQVIGRVLGAFDIARTNIFKCLVDKKFLNYFYEILIVHPRLIEAQDKFDLCRFIIKLLIIPWRYSICRSYCISKKFLLQRLWFPPLRFFSNWWNWCPISIKQFSLGSIWIIT